ncbi:efflux RND transporter periplasmic adaptor subunit [Pseudoduganella plicata]|uniref:Efflux RND transporter periplasmic adaptor subunit n=1 Tax=Pseudoduganella plicata TaxID=321984 RepID=A0A4V1AU07_9BURK|nr:efflux RND transporter periplasmic adaptor subunit [Pseudoduganella plicata]QBQ37508.1 efflux RND transporter periplasmic adaptor subunit [Pseudoduganella plicata]GGY90788.1 MexE family multidrug efflux RND transporter periplasmic adaptor subunit [Pseudoduganella plicata]
MIRSTFTLSLLALTAFAGAGAMSGCSRLQAAPGAPPPVPTVVVAQPERSMVQDTMDYTGRIEPSQRVEVRSRVSGYLQRIVFRDGQRVKAGDPLFVIDPRPFVAVRDRAQAALAQARAREKLAAAQYERSEKLRRTGADSQEELERARGEYESAHAAVLLSQAELRSAELELSFTTVRAPIAGTVSDRRVDVGNYVTGASAQSGVLTTLVAHDPVRAVVDLAESDFQRLRHLDKLPGKVELTLGRGVAVQAAAVDFVDNEISARSGTVRLRASLPNADRAVMPGSFARMRIPVGGPQERLLVPGSAVLSDQDKKMVFVVDADSKVAPRKLVLGRLVGDKQVVVSGLAPDERVIVSGAAKVRPGDHVKVAQAAAAGT